MIVPFAAGGPTDTIALVLAEAMGKFLGQPVVPENITGAAGTIAVGRTVQAPPDGYTIGIGHWSTHVLNGAIYALPYSLVTDLQPIAMVTTNPQLIIGKGALPAQDLRQLISWLKANPDKALQGTAGTGSPSHVAGVYFQKTTDTHFQFVPYRGGAPAMQALLAGQMDLGFEQAANVLPHLHSGIIKAYAVTSNSRLPAAPEVPTVEEAGLAGFYVSVWHGLWAPKGTPKEVVATLNNAAARALRDPTVRQRLTDLLGWYWRRPAFPRKPTRSPPSPICSMSSPKPARAHSRQSAAVVRRSFSKPYRTFRVAEPPADCKSAGGALQIATVASPSGHGHPGASHGG